MLCPLRYSAVPIHTPACCSPGQPPGLPIEVYGPLQLSAAETLQTFCAFPHSHGREACLQPYSAKSQRLHSVVPGNMENWRLEPAGLHIVLRRTLGIGPDAGAAEQHETTSSIDPQALEF